MENRVNCREACWPQGHGNPQPSLSHLRLEGSETIRLTSPWEDEIVQASSKVEGTCKEDVRGSSPRGGAKLFRYGFILIMEGIRIGFELLAKMVLFLVG